MIFDYIKNTSWSKRNIFAAAMVPIVMLALYNWFVSPQMQFLVAAQKYGNAAVKVERNNKIINTRLQTSQKKLDEVSEQFRQKTQDFFEIDDARKFLGDIQSNAEKNQCSVDTLKFLPAKQIVVNNGASVDMQQYQAILAVRGQYQNIIKLLDVLQNRKQKVWIDTLNLSHKDRTTDLLVCDLSLSIYTLKVKEIQSDVKSEK